VKLIKTRGSPISDSQRRRKRQKEKERERERLSKRYKQQEGVRQWRYAMVSMLEHL